MTPETWQRLQAAFEQVVDHPLHERPRAIARACGEDSTLQRAVEVLLASEEQTPILEKVVSGGLDLLEEAPLTDRRIGPYRLLERLGRGGMGEVFLAARADHEYRKEVAIKLLRPGFDSARFLERFRRERQILAQLEHPHIARLLEGGTTDDGKPYFVMEHVRGEPIDRYCDRNRLDVKARLELFRTVCAAVQYAHQNLVIHRDLKPSNILVTADGTVKLLDFGIAKLLAAPEAPGAAELTTAERPLTLSYASPEQVRGEPVTPAGDVYSLGCVLYELLAGRRAFDLQGKSRREAERLILEEPPLPPSVALSRSEDAVAVGRVRRLRPEALRRRLAGEIDVLVLATLHKDRRRRPSTAAELGAEVDRLLSGLPLKVHRDTWTYRARKYVLRNLGPMALVTLVLTFLAWAWWTSVRHAGRLADERDKALVVVEFLVDLFNSSDPRQSRGESVTARELLDRGAEDLELSLADEPAIKAMLADTIGRVYLQLGLPERARQLIRQGLTLRREHLGERHEDVARSLDNLGSTERASANYEASVRRHREALAIYRELDGDHRAGIAESTNNLALALGDLGRYEQAERLLRRALEVYRSLHEDDHRSIVRCLSNLALVLEDQGVYEEARAMTQEALDMARRLYREPHPEIALYLNNLASQLLQLGDLEGAERHYREALAMRRRVFEPGHPEILQAINNLAGLIYTTGDSATAESLYREAVESGRLSPGPDHPELGTYMTNLAILLRERDALDEAMALLSDALAIRRARLGEDHPEVVESLNSLASARLQAGEHSEAGELFEQARELSARVNGENHPTTILIVCNQARLHRYRDELAAAMRLQKRCLQSSMEELGEGHREVALNRSKLAELHAAAGDSATAAELYRQASEVQRRELGAGHWRLAESLTGLGAALTRLGALDEAERVLSEALEIYREAPRAKRWRVAEARSVLGGCLLAQGRLEEARVLLSDSLEQLTALRGEDHYLTRAAQARWLRYSSAQE